MVGAMAPEEIMRLPRDEQILLIEAKTIRRRQGPLLPRRSLQNNPPGRGSDALFSRRYWRNSLYDETKPPASCLTALFSGYLH
jgi:hypothetical protein